MTYRVTSLLGGVVTEDVEDFADEEAVIRAMRAAAPQEYVDEVKEWMQNGATEPLVIKESSVHSDVWEYIP